MSHTLSPLALLRFALWSLLYVPLTVSALGLGDVHVRSAMGQKLDAEIEFSALTAVEAESLIIRLASPETFVQAGIDYSPLLRSLRFSVEKKSDRQVIRLTSDLVISEPFLNLLIELNAAGNRTVRQYALLLDPPTIVEAPIVVNPPVSVAQSDSIRTEKADVAEETKPAPVPDVAAKTSAANPILTSNTNATSTSNIKKSNAPVTAPTKSDKHTVKPGETLAGIAAANRPYRASISQMLLALQRENPQALSENNINRLKAGSVLRIPDDDTVRAIDEGKAREFIRVQNTDFQRYREQIVRQSVRSRHNDAKVNPGTEAGQRGVRSSSGTVTLQPKESTVTPAAQDKLKLTAPAPERLPESDKSLAAAAKDASGNANHANTGIKRDRNAEVLNKIGSEKALADANSRIAALEKNISDMQQLANIQSQSLAEKQAAAEQSSSAQVPSPSPAFAPASESESTLPPQPTPSPALAPPPSTAPSTASIKPAAISKATQKIPSTPEPPVYENVVRALRELVHDSTTVSAGIGGLLLLILSWLGLRYRRRKQLPGEKPSEVDGAQSVFEQAGGRNIDTSNSVFHSNFVPSVSQLDTNEVDAVAEADVYIAYGRDEQAEEILQDALRLHPDRHALRVKLLEIYAARKDRQKFGTLAAELRVLTHGVGEAWVQAAQMGMVLDPGNLLYGAAMRNTAEFTSASPKPLAASPAATTSPVADFEFRLEGLLDERRSDITPSTSSLSTAGRLVSAEPTSPEVSSGATAGDFSNTLEFNLSDSFSSSISVSASPLLPSAPTATAQKSTVSVVQESDLASLKTKLDLAIACQEIGDHEGARELLAEVAASQHSELSQRAQSLLSQVA
jgi:pilus assembly protein FimV